MVKEALPENNGERNAAGRIVSSWNQRTEVGRKERAAVSD